MLLLAWAEDLGLLGQSRARRRPCFHKVRIVGFTRVEVLSRVVCFDHALFQGVDLYWLLRPDLLAKVSSHLPLGRVAVESE